MLGAFTAQTVIVLLFYAVIVLRFYSNGLRFHDRFLTVLSFIRAFVQGNSVTCKLLRNESGEYVTFQCKYISIAMLAKS